MESSETAGERALTKLEIQLDLIAQAFGEERFGKKFFDDGTLDYLYVRGVILVRDVYQPDVARVLEEQDEEEERGQEFVRVAGTKTRYRPYRSTYRYGRSRLTGVAGRVV